MADSSQARPAPAPGPEFLAPTFFMDSNHPLVQEFAAQAGGPGGPREQAVRLYYAVRDGARYDPYGIRREPEAYQASTVLRERAAFCIPKAVLLVAAARARGIPAALGFADVKNHLTTPKLRARMGTDLFIYHGYAALWLEGRWVKATPAFNIELCLKFQVLPLEFDGLHDSLMHPYDANNQRHMEYVQDHGLFADLPHAHIMSAFDGLYRGVFAGQAQQEPVAFGDETPVRP